MVEHNMAWKGNGLTGAAAVDYLNLCSGFSYVASMGGYFIPLIPPKEKYPFHSFHSPLIAQIRSCPRPDILSA